jgi:hypothetical protein
MEENPNSILFDEKVAIVTRQLKILKKSYFFNNFLFAIFAVCWIGINIFIFFIKDFEEPITFKISDINMVFILNILFICFNPLLKSQHNFILNKLKFGSNIDINDIYEYDVVFTKIEGNYIKIMREIRIIKNIGLLELKEGLEKLPFCFKKSVSLVEAMALKKYFENIGISVRIDSYQRIPTNLTD